MENPVKIVLVGVGGYGRLYVDALLGPANAGRAAPVAVVDPRPELCPRLDELKALGVPVFSNMEACLNRVDADLAIVSTPIHLHREHILCALRFGCDVLCEKPLCATVQDGLLLLREQERSGRQVAIGYQWSFTDEIQALKRDIRAGLFGRPLRFKAHDLTPRSDRYYGRASWSGCMTGDSGEWVLDSPLHNASAHKIHNMLYVLGDGPAQAARPVSVTAELYRANPIENADTAAVRCVTDRGVALMLFASHAVQDQAPNALCYEFEEATIECDPRGRVIVARRGDRELKRYGDPSAHDDLKLWKTIEAVRAGAPPLCTIASALPEVICANAAQESCPPRPFPAAMTSVREAGGERWTYAPSLSADLLRCYAEWKLPSEAGLGWAVPGRAMDTANYERFPSSGSAA